MRVGRLLDDQRVRVEHVAAGVAADHGEDRRLGHGSGLDRRLDVGEARHRLGFERGARRRRGRRHRRAPRRSRPGPARPGPSRCATPAARPGRAISPSCATVTPPATATTCCQRVASRVTSSPASSARSETQPSSDGTTASIDFHSSSMASAEPSASSTSAGSPATRRGLVVVEDEVALLEPQQLEQHVGRAVGQRGPAGLAGHDGPVGQPQRTRPAGPGQAQPTGLVGRRQQAQHVGKGKGFERALKSHGDLRKGNGTLLHRQPGATNRGRFRESSAARWRAPRLGASTSIGAGRPVQISKATAAWRTSIPSPPRVRAPRAGRGLQQGRLAPARRRCRPRGGRSPSTDGVDRQRRAVHAHRGGVHDQVSLGDGIRSGHPARRARQRGRDRGRVRGAVDHRDLAGARLGQRQHERPGRPAGADHDATAAARIEPGIGRERGDEAVAVGVVPDQRAVAPRDAVDRARARAPAGRARRGPPGGRPPPPCAAW